jgi:hypothetical protein
MTIIYNGSYIVSRVSQITRTLYADPLKCFSEERSAGRWEVILPKRDSLQCHPLHLIFPFDVIKDRYLRKVRIRCVPINFSQELDVLLVFIQFIFLVYNLTNNYLNETSTIILCDLVEGGPYEGNGIHC